ncbi:MAG: hypothetical protein R3B48_00820 [Kofleriaceae bacterium]
MTDDDSPPPPEREPTVRQLLDDPDAHAEVLDPATLAELQRWFGLPSAMDVEVEPEPTEPTRREAALAAVEPSFLEYLHRLETRLPAMIEDPNLELRLDETMSTTPERFSAAAGLGEPREIEVPYQLIDDLNDRVPQALLRDLHRTEEYFSIYYELTQVDEGIPDVQRQIAAAIEYGERERQLIAPRDQVTHAMRDREEIHTIVWATAAKAAPPPETEEGEPAP